MAEDWIVPGDWIIRNAPPEMPVAAGGDMPSFGKGVDYSFTDHATFVLDVTKTHLTLFDPWVAKPVIFQRSRLEGDWHWATEGQVAITWEMAKMVRSREAMYSIGAEKERYPFRRRHD